MEKEALTLLLSLKAGKDKTFVIEMLRKCCNYDFEECLSICQRAGL